MQYSKAMIDLLKEARRRVPTEDKASIKLANPDVFQELHVIFRKSNDTILKVLIKELFAQAGEPWSRVLEQRDAEVETRHVVKSYRGVMQLAETGRPVATGRDVSKKKIYRGQPVPE